jgi:rubrerythrin
MDREKAIKGLKIAIQTELNGIEFYKLAAEKTEDPEGKKMFTMLADDELKHFRALKKHFISMVKTSKWDPSISLTEVSTGLDGKSPIFSDTFKERIKEKHFEMSALSIGALLETSSIDFYRKMKEEVDDKGVKNLFTILQKWEENHLETITNQLNLLKEEYWADQQFTPLF